MTGWKLIAAVLGAFALGGGGAALADQVDSPSLGSTSLAGITSTSDTTGTTETTGTVTTTATTATGTVEDISGPCDEAEHANDPRCTGPAVTADDDNSGHGGGDDDHDNSGHGGGDDD
jgi:hypothetical protein